GRTLRHPGRVGTREGWSRQAGDPLPQPRRTRRHPAKDALIPKGMKDEAPRPVSLVVNPRQRQFEALTRAHAGDLYRFAYWLCGQEALAQDLVQETMLRAWKSLDALREAEAAKPWLLTILRREHARHHERKQLDTVELNEGITDDAAWASPERHGDAAELRE